MGLYFFSPFLLRWLIAVAHNMSLHSGFSLCLASPFSSCLSLSLFSIQHLCLVLSLPPPPLFLHQSSDKSRILFHLASHHRLARIICPPITLDSCRAQFCAAVPGTHNAQRTVSGMRGKVLHCIHYFTQCSRPLCSQMSGQNPKGMQGDALDSGHGLSL